jgi:carbonic anhydrase
VQFHFHTPSEHTVEGKPFSLEMHIVHVLDSGAGKDYQYQKAVIGVVFDDSKDIPNAFIDSLHPEAPGTPLNIDLPGFMSKLSSTFYHYGGSLTTPPCTEEVNW